MGEVDLGESGMFLGGGGRAGASENLVQSGTLYFIFYELTHDRKIETLQ